MGSDQIAFGDNKAYKETRFINENQETVEVDLHRLEILKQVHLANLKK